MRSNVKTKIAKPVTHEGGAAVTLSPLAELRRSVSSCLLFEGTFYEDGVTIADRIRDLSHQVSATDLALLAIEARSEMNLRHVPLQLVLHLIERGVPGAADVVEAVIQRPDEMGELISLYRKDMPRKPLPHALTTGISKAFGKFDEYSLAKNDHASAAYRLRDVIRLTHPKPADDDRSALYGRITRGEMQVPDTWETALSAGADKRETFTRLLSENRLGYLALLRNLRNMTAAGVESGLIRKAIIARRGADRVLPFRYVAAARACPQMEPALDQALCESIAQSPRLSGRTFVLVDVSGSMDAKLSGKSDITRMDAAATLAAVIPGDVRMFSFSTIVKEVPPRRGMAGVDAIIRSQLHGGTYLWEAITTMNQHMTPEDRLIVITDEQAADSRNGAETVAGRSYLINVAPSKNGVVHADAKSKWNRIDGFSESVLRWIMVHEAG